MSPHASRERPAQYPLDPTWQPLESGSERRFQVLCAAVAGASLALVARCRSNPAPGELRSWQVSTSASQCHGSLAGWLGRELRQRQSGAVFMAEQKLRHLDDIPAGHTTGIWAWAW